MRSHSVRCSVIRSFSSVLWRPMALVGILGVLLCACGDSGSPSNGGSGGDGGVGGEAGGGAGGGTVAERRMFVTRAAQNADFGGIEGADALCAQEASEAQLEGDFKAWLSTRSSSVAQRLAPAEDAPYVLVDGTLVATGWDDLLDGSIAVEVALDASGERRAGDVWTGTLATGESYDVDDCNGFSSATTGSGLCGKTSSRGSAWTESAVPPCSTVLRLYCIEQ
jgi:hypothetical protein